MIDMNKIGSTKAQHRSEYTTSCKTVVTKNCASGVLGN